MSGSSPEIGELLDAGRREAGLGDARRRENRGRLLARVGAGVAVASTTVSASAAVANSAAVPLVVKIVVGAVFLSAAGLGARAWTHRAADPTRAPSAPVAAAPSTAPSAEVAPVSSRIYAQASPQDGAVAPRRAPPTPLAHAAEPSLDSDIQLLRDVDAALRSGRAEAALRVLDDRRSHGSAGALVQERAASRVVVLCALRRTEEARAAASNFLRQWPDSPLTPRVRSACDASAIPPRAL